MLAAQTSLEEFVCSLYGQSVCQNGNEARYNIFKLNARSESAMPPNQDALRKHILRANYQAAIHKACLKQFPDVPSPIGHGWVISENELSIDWMDLPPAPSGILEYVQCSCKKSKCRQRTCSCTQSGLPCTDLCKCKDCDNAVEVNEIDDIEEYYSEEGDL
ncbi:hypothetical protein HOLleu_26725 [Holothuria leucospilota]|uniref:CRC domain-containing protein n=1 Tax=Holothuria leucospilota TaxID=206669 RepID=A0A9Q1BPE2_HOLLE|nr:hypothetical protein HOLleu_26725 [Holothuria leucospilota]